MNSFCLVDAATNTKTEMVLFFQCANIIVFPLLGEPKEKLTRMNKRIYTGSPWEQKVAYSRALRRGNHVAVAGTIAVDEQGEIVGTTAYEQAKYIFEKVEGVLNALECSLSDVVRTRTFIVGFQHFDGFARAHQEVFEQLDPAASCVGVSSLILPEALLEIEIDAVILDGT